MPISEPQKVRLVYDVMSFSLGLWEHGETFLWIRMTQRPMLSSEIWIASNIKLLPILATL